MEIPNTTENRVLAGAVNSRIKADARILNAKAAFWRLAGLSMLLAMVGVGIGAALFGWTYSRGPSIEAEQVARAVAAAMEKVTLKTEGTVKLDPDARIAAAAPVVPRPSEAQLGEGQKPASQAAVATAFTVFKEVPHGDGKVVTGWNFAASDQKLPNYQYCYYSERTGGGASVSVSLGENGSPNPEARVRGTMQPASAYANCVWFRAGSI